MDRIALVREGKTFKVVDNALKITLKRNLKGSKAAAYVDYYKQEITKAELFWSQYDAKH